MRGASLPLDVRYPADTTFGRRIMALADRLAAHSETSQGLTCTFLSPAHRAVANEIATLMKAAGLARVD